MDEALATIHCVPDCKLPKDVQLLYGHRTMEQTEIYFISNQENKEVTVYPEFRVQRKQPELWNAINGRSVLYRLIGGQKLELSFH